VQAGLDQIARIIQIILVPAVMITTCALLIGGVQQRYIAMGDRLRLLNSERLSLVRSSSQTPSDPLISLRLAEIAAQSPRIVHRHRLVRDGAVLLYVAIACDIVTMLLLAAADIAANHVPAPLILLAFLLGTVLMFGGIVVIIVELVASHREIADEMHHTQAWTADGQSGTCTHLEPHHPA
jgi:hypothetical protein